MGLTWEECGGYVPVMERNHNPTAHDEMMRMLDECARLGKENAELRRLAVAVEADATEPKHRREWARELLTPNGEVRGEGKLRLPESSAEGATSTVVLEGKE